MLTRQLEREKQMQLQGVLEAKRNVEKALSTGSAQQLYGSYRILAALFEQLHDRYAVISSTTKPGPGGKMKAWFRSISTETMAVLALNEVITLTLTKENTSLQLLLLSLGRRIHLESLVGAAAKVSPLYIQRTEERLAKSATKSRSHYTRTMRTAARNVLQEMEFLLDSEYMQLGKLALNEIIDLGIIERQPQRGVHVYSLNRAIYDALCAVPEFLGGKVALSMLVPPVPWTSITEGGYYTSPWHPLVKRGRYRREDYKQVNAVLTGSSLLDTLNYIQGIPLKLRQDTTSVITELWQEGGGALGVPTREFSEPPEYPLADGWKEQPDAEQSRVQHDLWCSMMQQWYSDKREHRSSVLEMVHLIKGIDEPEQPMWNPVFCDSRSRMYYRGRINPQGSDRAKSLVSFHEGRALGDRGLYWLKVALANSFGYDSTRFDDRVAWTDSNLDFILEGSERPQDSDFFRSNTEAPCMAISIAQELAGALRSDNPEGYISHVPVHMDATCSGLQHLSALLRDSEGAMHVNLIDNGLAQKSDLYTHVANLAIDLAAQDLGTEDAVHAEWWIRNGIPRSLAKRPVMTYCYGVTFQGVIRYVDEYLYKAGFVQTQDAPSFQNRNYCARLLLRAISIAVPKATQFMHWLQEAVRGRQAEHIQWTTAVGFPVVQYIEGTKQKRINIRSCGIQQMVMYERTGAPHKVKMVNSIVPNLVHGNDATHWYMTADKARLDNRQVMGIHDSFGTHACDVDAMHVDFRSSFIELYENYDLIGNFITENNLELEAPQLGDFNLNHFMQSEFGFC